MQRLVVTFFKFLQIFPVEEVPVTRVAIAFVATALAVFSAPTVSARSSQPRQLTFEDRVRAQEALERGCYSDQIGEPCDEPVPRTALAWKVHGNHKESAVLKQIWDAPLTGSSPQANLSRVRVGRSADCLRESFEALDQGVVLIQECPVRLTQLSPEGANGVDLQIPSGKPGRKFTSPIVTVGVRK